MRVSTTAKLAGLTAAAAVATTAALVVAGGGSTTESPTRSDHVVVDTGRGSGASEGQSVEALRVPVVEGVRSAGQDGVESPRLSTQRVERNETAAVNTAQSSTGGFLQSHGICGYGQFNFTIDSRNFEYVQLGISSGTTMLWGEPFAVSQGWRSTVPVNAFQNVSYFVRGWDWTARGWETTEVLTDFWYPNTQYDLNGC